MRRRVHPRASTSRAAVAVDVRKLEATRLVTLDDPAGDAASASGAFVRLRPPEGTSPEQTALWREAVARVALAVRVVAAPRAALVPASSDRSDDDEPVGTIREEAEKLAAETNDPDVVALVARVLDEVGA